MFAWTLVEFIGTFVFLSVILSQAQAIPIAVALATAIYFGAGHYNPAVTFMETIGGNIGVLEAAILIVAQLIAAISAYGFSKYVLMK